jgi:hypothetical protein
MTKPKRSGVDELERIVLTTISDFGWHAVNVIEDDGHPPWTVLRLAGPFVRCAPLPAPLTVRPPLPVAAFAGTRLTLHSPGDGESKA